MSLEMVPVNSVLLQISYGVIRSAIWRSEEGTCTCVLEHPALWCMRCLSEWDCCAQSRGAASGKEGDIHGLYQHPVPLQTSSRMLQVRTGDLR